MGLFGFIKKGIGKVAKAGLSVVTRGLSDKAFKVLKDVGQAKQAAKQAQANQVTLQTYARMAKLTPKVSQTSTPKAVKLALRPMGEKAPRKARKKATRKKGATKVTRATGTGRKPPKGGLDLAAIGRAWRAAGKPGTWAGYVKANPIKKK